MSDKELEWQKYFAENFFDVKRHKPVKGQVLACYRAIGYFVDDWIKRNVINLLIKKENCASSARQIMRNLIGATERDSVRVLVEMTDDLMNGMTVEEVAKHEYKMTVEYFFWTKKECIPENDPHWSSVSILNEDVEKQIEKAVPLESNP